MEMRQTGIEAIGQAPWGAHFCQFYATKEDLLETLVPYFKAGLEGDEFCMWVTSPPLGVREAWDALSKVVPDLESYRRRNRIEIIPYTDWYVLGGGFEQDRVLKGWVRKLDEALARGCSGLRLTGNTFWLEKSDWKSFAEYEGVVDSVIGQYRMVALCTYSLERCGASEIADVIKNHQFALLKRGGSWELIESFDRRRLEDIHAREIAVERERLAVTLQSIGDAVIATDTAGRVTMLNGVAEELTGWPQAEAAGQPLDKVFRIVNEATGAPVEDPVRKALEAGAVVGLANHTTLIAKDGTRRAIADSAAPIRGRGGEIVGVVLVFRDVTNDRQAEEALREADRHKNEFLAMLSHELRNPLAPIRNSLYVLDRAAPGGDQARRAQAVIGRQVKHLTCLVDDLLDVTRIARGKVQLQVDLLELGDVVRHAVEDHRGDFAKNEIALEAKIASETMWLNGDETRIAQVIGNLLQNAAKFTPRGGRVALSLERSGQEALLRVRDTGVGIAPEVLARLFQPFTQAEQTLDRSRGGLGLGLALVKGLVGLHGGSVGATSDGMGRGAEFTVRLPLVAAPSKRARVPESPQVLKRRVLIIEDNVDAADSLKEALEFTGHDVRVAYDGPAGIASARDFRPEYVLCDIGLPGMNGHEVAREFRADKVLKGAVLVALSGYTLPEDRARAMEAGFIHHVAKPPSLEVLERILGEHSE